MRKTAEGVVLAQADGLGAALRQRLRQHKQAVAEIEKRDDACDDKGYLRVVAAKKTAQRRADQKARAEHGADPAEGGRAFITRGDVGNISLSNGNIGRKESAQNAACENSREGSADGGHREHDA